MRIVSWNCNGAFRNKYTVLFDLKADIYVIQECENPSESRNKNYEEWAANHLWAGDNKNKGLGVFASSNVEIKSLNWSNEYEGHSVKYFLPCLINNDFQLLAVWAHKNNSPNFGYIGQLWKYIQLNKSNFKKIIITGDFNSNSIWDQWDRWWNHSDVVKELHKLGIESLYHKRYNEEHGKESKATFFLHRNMKKPYHIDYSFACCDIYDKMITIDIKDYNAWKKYSDHAPLLADFSI
jgi:exonuclease III